MTALPLSPFEGFFLSRVDGEANVALLADLTNLEQQAVLELIERLIGMGIVEWARETVSLPRATGRSFAGTPSDSFQPPERRPSTPPSSARPHGNPRGRVRLTRRAPSVQGGAYASKPGVEERVDASRRPVSRPRASHTGSMVPPGVIEDGDDPKSLEELAAELGGITQELSGHPAPTDRGATDLDATAPEATAPDADAATADTDRPPPVESPAPRAIAPEPDPADDTAVEGPKDAPPDGAARDDAPDLAPERRKRIDDLYFALELLDHYEVLGVPRTGVRAEIRLAYFTLSKVFHPDTMFGKRLGVYKSRMEAVFQRITEAYEVLSKKKARADYDRYLEVSDRTRAIEAAVSEPDTESDAVAQRGRDAARQDASKPAEKPRTPSDGGEPPVSSSPPEPVSSSPPASSSPPSEPAPPVPPRRSMSPEGQARARELMAKKLRGATRRSTPAKPAAASPSVAPIGRDNVLRGLARSLKDTAAHTGGLDPVRRHEMAADRALREGNLADAASALRLALTLAPERSDLRSQHARINADLAAELASSYEEQAMYEQRHGKWAAAALSWAKVFEGRPNDAEPARRAAECLLEANGDLHHARVLAQRAVDIAPEDVPSLRALARVYIGAGLALNARRVLQKAQTLDPDDKMVENLLRDLGP
ncbi:MAG: DnaJ domain-containing protein [Sandaracinaceae bacterium]